MNDQTPIRLTVDEFLAWVPDQDGRWELIDGRPVRMPSETFGPVDVRSLVWLALKELVEGNDNRRDRVDKRRDYFSLPSVAHYLVVDPDDHTVLHFGRSNRQSEGCVLSEADTADLSPPGLRLPVRRCFNFR